MTRTVILPYTAQRTTPQDITRLRAALAAQAPDVALRSFETTCIPVWLADPLPPPVVTVTLNNDAAPYLMQFVPGRQFFAPVLSKAALLDRVIQAGIPVPKSAALHPVSQPTEADFGPYITIKTTAPGTTRATGITVCRTANFEALRPKITQMYQSDIARGFVPLLQQYVSTGPRPCHTRVTTFLGAPIVCFSTTARAPFDPAALTGLAAGEATSNFREDRTRVLVDDAEMVALATRVAAVFPETSVLSIDMVRCAQTGRIYCLEANQGNLSVLSAPILGVLRQKLGEDAMLAQFGAYDTMAKRIVEVLETP
ncbi:hypothetical protein Z945_3731 [Sulfitobacter noctilucae]|uniref:hypothetical protein n=1 Tax=Sulfitobacter noctilucae TaxID=1342302 RepID=UPI00046A051B|nr:hypothetical protein [Sulfitobacter noctilucae]KIN70128.1 hypothetical protein Z945_3731 [Sulfitobacter noctilucae]